MRKIIQILLHHDHRGEGEATLFCLCDTGEIWCLTAGEWIVIQAIPQPEPVDVQPDPRQPAPIDEIDLKFVDRMAYEIRENAYKGDWKTWNPGRDMILERLAHNLSCLEHQLTSAPMKRGYIGETCADIANLMMKCYAIYGGPALEKPHQDVY